ncbi:MAG: ABC transporter permease [Halanaerobiales bacterium]
MTFIDQLKLAYAGITANKLRSLLTLLGIVIGVGAIILMISLGSSVENVISGEFAEMTTSQVRISPNYNISESQWGELSTRDKDYLRDGVYGAEEAWLFHQDMFGVFEVEYRDEQEQVSLLGMEPEAEDGRSFELKAGNYFGVREDRQREKVAIVGEMIASSFSELEESVDLLGEEITIEGEEFMVIGIIDESSSDMVVSAQNVAIPFSTAEDVWADRFENPGFMILEYDGQNHSGEDIVRQARQLLNERYGEPVNAESRFIIESFEQNIEISQTVIKVLNYLLGSIAAISLFVGGVGVMNIMLVSVKERTREIGLRMALGATRQEIRIQFVLETIYLSLGGGILGVITGSGFSFIINLIIGHFLDWWEFVIPLWIIAVSFGITVIIGIVFGFYPAYKASNLDPIEALRYE